MELNNLGGFVLLLLLVGMLVGVGVLTLDYFGDAAKDDTSISESIAIAGAVGQTANDEVVSLTSFSNASTTWSIGNQINFTEYGVITTSNVSNGTYTLVYVYEADSKTTTATGSARDEVSAINTTWLTLIVTIAILALIMLMVTRSFSGRN